MSNKIIENSKIDDAPGQLFKMILKMILKVSYGIHGLSL